MVARHFETEKNSLDIHGASRLSQLTSTGQEQARRMVDVIARRYRDLLDGVLATPTPQAVRSAEFLATALGVPFVGLLNLAPVRLGVAEGLSTDDLRERHPEAFRSLDLFRARITSGSDVNLPGGEPSQEIQRRLTEWWLDEGRSALPGRLTIGSNSTVLMITHLLNDVSPTDARYKFLAVPNGTFRVWHRADDTWVTSPRLDDFSWPDVRLSHVPTHHGGRVAVTCHAPSWSPRERAVVIVPGYFGSSRHGPYGLYNRLARAWAWEGHTTITVDPLGSGDSSPVHRDFESEVQSAVAVCEWALTSHRSLLIVGHSMGGATALEARSMLRRADCAVWGLAPLCRLDDISRGMLSAQQEADLRVNGRTYRHGLELRREMLLGAERAWERHSSTIDRVWLPLADRYLQGVDFSQIPPERIETIPRADHNFAADDSVTLLASATLGALREDQRRD